jgi:hypothetical protein
LKNRFLRVRLVYKVHIPIHLEYHNVCPSIPSSKLGPPTPLPLPQASVPPPLHPEPGWGRGGGGSHSPACEEVGESHSDDWGKILALCGLVRCRLTVENIVYNLISHIHSYEYTPIPSFHQLMHSERLCLRKTTYFA